MTRDGWTMQRALLISLAFHACLLTLFFVLPGSGGPARPVQIYTIHIMEAPPRPQARALSLSTDVISALKLESPSLSPDAPPLPAPKQAEVPAMERLPKVPNATGEAAPPAPSAATTPSGTPAPPQAQPPALPPSSDLPTLPQVAPSAPPQAPPRAATGPKAPPAPGPEALAPPLAPVPTAPSRQTPMEQLSQKVKSLNLKVETAPATAGTPAEEPGTGGERNVLSLRIYTNRVREAVKKQYAFPGGFSPSLRTRVRVQLNRDGSVRKAEVLESSGNERFDRLVCLAAIHKANIPPVPKKIEGQGDSLTLYFTCSP